MEDQGSGTCELGPVNEMRKLNLSTTRLLQIRFANATARRVVADTLRVQDGIKAKPQGTGLNLFILSCTLFLVCLFHFVCSESRPIQQAALPYGHGRSRPCTQHSVYSASLQSNALHFPSCNTLIGGELLLCYICCDVIMQLIYTYLHMKFCQHVKHRKPVTSCVQPT